MRFREEKPATSERAIAGAAEVRFGVSVGRRVGGAVERNRVKRLLREAFWGMQERVSATHDYVVVARRERPQVAESGGLGVVRDELESLFAKLRATPIARHRR